MEVLIQNHLAFFIPENEISNICKCLEKLQSIWPGAGKRDPTGQVGRASAYLLVHFLSDLILKRKEPTCIDTYYVTGMYIQLSLFILTTVFPGRCLANQGTEAQRRSQDPKARNGWTGNQSQTCLQSPNASQPKLTVYLLMSNRWGSNPKTASN